MNVKDGAQKEFKISMIDSYIHRHGKLGRETDRIVFLLGLAREMIILVGQKVRQWLK